MPNLWSDTAKEWLLVGRGHRVAGTQMIIDKEGGVAWSLMVPYLQNLLCESDGDACGVCSHCQQVAKFTHPDLRLSFPHITEQSKQEDVGIDASTQQLFREFLGDNPFPLLHNWQHALGAEKKSLLIPSTEATAISKWLNIKPLMAKRKVVVMWLPERMNDSAANKLLKSFEEPAAHVKIVMISHDEEAVLGTIRSRCLPTYLEPAVNLSKYLEEAHQINPTQCQVVTELAQSRPGLALEYLTHRELLAQPIEAFITLMRSAFKRDAVALLVWSDQLSSWTREELGNFFHVSGMMLSQLNRMRHGYEGHHMFEWFPEIDFKPQGFAKVLDDATLKLALEELGRAQKDIRRNLNARIVLYDFGLSLLKAFATRTSS